MASRTTLPETLIANTARLDATDGDGDDQSRGRTSTARRRRRRGSPGGKVTGRKFQIPDAVFERVQQEAIRRRSNPSAVVADFLDRYLPHFRVEKFDKPPTGDVE